MPANLSAESVANTPVYQRLYVNVLLLVLLVAFALVMVFQVAGNTYRAEVEEWQVRLGLIADSRAEAVQGWVDAQLEEMNGLAENASLQLYMTEISAGSAVGQDTYLRHLLTITAERGRFAPADRTGTVPANVEVPARGGIALLDQSRKPIVSTPRMPPLSGRLEEFLIAAKAAEPAVMDMHEGPDGNPAMAFLVPVYAIQGDGQPSDQIGWVLGYRAVDASLFALLRHPGITERTLETALVRRDNDGMLTYLSPLIDGSEPLQKRWPLADRSVESAGGYVLDYPGHFAIRQDYTMQPVLVTGRVIRHTPWVLLTRISEAEALSEGAARAQSLLGMMVLGIAVVLIAIIAAWRHGASRYALDLARRLNVALRQARGREQLLSAITNHQPSSIFLLDEEHRCWYANEAMAERARLPRENIPGKKLDHLLGAALAQEFSAVSDRAMESGEVEEGLRRERDENGEEHVYRSKYIPLAHLPTEGAEVADQPGVLVVEQDITDMVRERERRERALGALVAGMVKMVDRRDPYAANHSSLVAVIARAVAEEMQLQPVWVDTTETAGRLMNIGKMEVPAEWLTKAGKLGAKEKQTIRDSLLASADMLEGVEFDGPVAETLRHSLEHWDGSGPQGLKGEDILVSARIIAVVNSFVSMVSARAYRKALPAEKALANLMEGMGKEYDRRVVLALANFIENRGGDVVVAEAAKLETAE